MRKLKKSLLIAAAILILLVALVIAFISPATKYAIQKYDEQYLGRQITLDRAYVNPFTGYIRFSNLKIYESESDSIFFSANSISANFAMLKLITKTYEISKLTLDKPHGTIIQNKTGFNFNDLIELFSPDEDRDTSASPVRFSLLNVKINDGEFHYIEEELPVNYFIKNVNIESTGMRWNADTTAANFSFSSGIGTGDINGDFTINLKNMDYRVAVVVEKFDLDIIEQYLQDLTNYGCFVANIDAEVKATGNLNDQENLTASGLVEINEFHFGKTPDLDYLAFEKLIVSINEASPKKNQYYLDSITLERPYFKYERFDYLDNLQMMFGKDGDKITAATADAAKFNLVIEIARYVEVLAKNFLRSYYKIDRFAIYNADIKFNDFSLSEKFAVELNPLTILADSIDKNKEKVDISLKSAVKPYGNLTVSLSINPQDSSFFDLQYQLEKIPLSMFNAYTITYTSFPLDRGTLGLKGTWNVRNGKIQSDNRLLIIDPRTAKRLRNQDTRWIPVPLIMAFVRERGNHIDYEIPITGDLNDPDFHLSDVILKVLGNIFIKPATIPYILEVKNTETEIEKSFAMKWEMRQSEILPTQEKFIDQIADFLVKTPEAIITVYPQQYALKEMEYILLFEAKKKYYMLTNGKNAQSFSEEDAAAVDKMSIKDSQFVNYLNKQINDSLIFTVQEKCALLMDSAFMIARFEELNAEREKKFIAYFKEREVEKQVKIAVGKNVIPYNGFSFYKIDYHGDFPEFLMKAYRQMVELNDEAPRKEYKKQRKENLSKVKEPVAESL